MANILVEGSNIDLDESDARNRITIASSGAVTAQLRSYTTPGSIGDNWFDTGITPTRNFAAVASGDGDDDSGVVSLSQWAELETGTPGGSWDTGTRLRFDSTNPNNPSVGRSPTGTILVGAQGAGPFVSAVTTFHIFY